MSGVLGWFSGLHTLLCLPRKRAGLGPPPVCSGPTYEVWSWPREINLEMGLGRMKGGREPAYTAFVLNGPHMYVEERVLNKPLGLSGLWPYSFE